ncbi:MULTISPECIES: DMT family transporter [unclassified Paenibacillus]|uniref:DMT family transporter n=1 Tax=unclassified Paenibacillus TaxID=185978 RepID=UPI0009A8C224|nr:MULTISPECIES: DMT family transporter [unclassified Paenibacillus]SLK20955.1 Permease of the drug/metabolite transporter (DMT) superfamily [Paenibacillus sp. RU5A]SOC76395.1 Permease of the drug/metabolite transporter (DMT) superfamily [Paenibacillus sp. RU26A]SOC77921.1 Permease of the drug/metabolite transporter (DMT) superfamily [Paenibacillus sp. RU5M]
MKKNKSLSLSHPYILLFISILSISISSIMIKSSDTPTSVAGMYRLFISVILMLPFVPWKKLRLMEMGKKDWTSVLLAGLFLGLYFLSWMESLVYTSVASSMVILSLQPLFVMIGSYFLFKERVTVVTILCLIAALSGTIIIACGDIGVSREALIGDGLSLLGTLLVSAYMLAGQKVSHKIDANIYSVIVFFLGGCVMLVYNLLNHTSLMEYNSSDWIYFFLLALIPTIFGQYLINLLLKSLGATTVSVGIIGEPILAIILAYAFLGESISGFQFIGGMMTILGMGGYFRAKSWSYTVANDQK